MESGSDTDVSSDFFVSSGSDNEPPPEEKSPAMPKETSSSDARGKKRKKTKKKVVENAEAAEAADTSSRSRVYHSGNQKKAVDITKTVQLDNIAEWKRGLSEVTETQRSDVLATIANQTMYVGQEPNARVGGKPKEMWFVTASGGDHLIKMPVKTVKAIFCILSKKPIGTRIDTAMRSLCKDILGHGMPDQLVVANARSARAKRTKTIQISDALVSDDTPVAAPASPCSAAPALPTTKVAPLDVVAVAFKHIRAFMAEVEGHTEA
ncbi:MAG: hypothetical protein CMO80_14190 [Verrucomicrobiales bacterium]|nr:hypothetical protein [Verrucomicrobiales bacterium]|tara:strand:- start:466 stop:1260 length:795 start_codon:yes stop_codon:yes gene_type:complete